ncbi:TPA: hypothetical protein UM521_000913 [Stenotrophomonas maltophilia]|nr:hypothetical protein [Stenotrophomonas maltophilia]HEL4213929.1 hypothetical protein [Stenotrophomonas maltophilia]HEL4270532.1 hypothetical protein [Stenotrophomonas maltophilia]HEL4301680.1 hypothetical protein [Stenotrophomonas maltophilia]HEL4814439.1 hypothetical protein [Stenotrophomonas maltophilia]
MSPFESWITFQQMSLFAGIVIFYCVVLTVPVVLVLAHTPLSNDTLMKECPPA